MTVQRYLHFLRVWFGNILSFKALAAIFSSYGALWLLVEISIFFLRDPTWSDSLRQYWGWFGVTGFVVAVIICKPHLSVSEKIKGRDVTIEIAVGDLFAFSGAYIIGSNTTFDTRISRDLISDKSVQAAFTKKFYGDTSQLDQELSSKLKDVPSRNLEGERLGKIKRYPIGTCVRLSPKSCTAYFVAIADINEHGVAAGTFDNLKESLAKLWVFIGNRGLKESLVMPVLGTGFSRLSQTRDEVIREIVKSFIAACSEKTFVDKLTIVITPKDIIEHNISLIQLGYFLRHECQYVSFATGSQPSSGGPELIGTGIGV